MTLALLCTAAQEAWTCDGSGTSTDPYLIRTNEDLDQLAIEVNSGWDTSGMYVKLVNDLTYGDGRGRGSNFTDKSSAENGTNFTPIGRNANDNVPAFKGTFDGDGPISTSQPARARFTMEVPSLAATPSSPVVAVAAVP